MLNFNGTGTTANMTHSGGTLGGTGALTVSGTLSWTGGTQTGAGTTTIAATATGTIDSATTQVALIGGRTLQNNGTITWLAGQIDAGDSVLENAGTFDAEGRRHLRVCRQSAAADPQHRHLQEDRRHRHDRRSRPRSTTTAR